MIRLHLPHAIVESLHANSINVIILTSETVGTVSVWTVACSCWKDFPSRTKPGILLGLLHKGLTTTQTLLILAPLNGNKEEEQGANDTPKEGLSRPAFFIPRWITLLCIQDQVFFTRGATALVFKGVSQWPFLTWTAQRQSPSVYLG